MVATMGCLKWLPSTMPARSWRWSARMWRLGNTIRLYGRRPPAQPTFRVVLHRGKTYTSMSKDLVVDRKQILDSSSETIDNMEGMAFGPTLPDGRRLLVLVSDDNFDPKYGTRVHRARSRVGTGQLAR